MSQISEDAVRLALATVREQLAAEITEAIEKAIAQERAAVVAFIRAAANAPHPIERGAPMLSPSGRGLLLLHADAIDRGEHRREEGA